MHDAPARRHPVNRSGLNPLRVPETVAMDHGALE